MEEKMLKFINIGQQSPKKRGQFEVNVTKIQSSFFLCYTDFQRSWAYPESNNGSKGPNPMS